MSFSISGVEILSISCGVVCNGKEPMGGIAGRLVFRSKAQEAGNQYVKWCLFPGNSSNNRFNKPAVLLPDNLQYVSNSKQWQYLNKNGNR